MPGIYIIALVQAYTTYQFSEALHLRGGKKTSMDINGSTYWADTKDPEMGNFGSGHTEVFGPGYQLDILIFVSFLNLF